MASIAHAHGFFWETLWNDPNNAALRDSRGDPGTLLPGDRVFIPKRRRREEGAPTEASHRFVLKNCPVYLRLRLLDEQDEPRANLDYTLIIDGSSRTGTTDGDGCIDEPIAPNASRVTLRIDPPPPDPADRDEQVYTGPEREPEEREEPDAEEYDIQLGHTDPLEAVSGLQNRLINLGYDLDGAGGEYDERTRAAVRALQSQEGLEETGEIDDATRDRLEKRHQS